MHDQVILMDVEVQRDFFQPGGTLYQRSNNKVTANVYRLFNWARATGAKVISSILLVRPGEHGPLSATPHCVEGSGGEVKLGRTILPRHINLGSARTTDLPADLLDSYQQVIFEKRENDLFRHSKAERLLTELPPGLTFLICGAGLAGGIKLTVVGLRTRGFGVIVVEDAVLDLADPRTEMAWLQMLAKGAQPMPTSQVLREFKPAGRVGLALRR